MAESSWWQVSTKEPKEPISREKDLSESHSVGASWWLVAEETMLDCPHCKSDERHASERVLLIHPLGQKQGEGWFSLAVRSKVEAVKNNKRNKPKQTILL